METKVATAQLQNQIKTSPMRQSNFELLRIVCIFFIIAHHYVTHSGLLTIDFGLNQIICQGIVIGGKIGVNCFILISAYFLYTSEFKIKKLLKIILETAFYSILFLLLFYFLHLRIFGFSEILVCTFPTTFSAYWFVTAYVGLYLLFPFLNKIFRNMEQAIHKKLLIVLTIMLVILPTIFLVTAPFYGNLIWFIYLYTLAVYLRKYPFVNLHSKKFHACVFMISWLMIWLLTVLLASLSNSYTFLKPFVDIFYRIHTLPVLLCSISLFALFQQISIRNSNFINKIAACSLGIYLIHDNPIVRNYLWQNIFKVQEYFYLPFFSFLLYSVLVIFSVYVFCTLIELLRMYLIEKPLFKFKKLDCYFSKLDHWINA